MAFSSQMEAPICLVEKTDDGEFVARPDALKILASLNQPLIVVSMVGKYGTGKSYLLNRIGNVRTGSGFAVGSTAEGHTKGIWMWCVPHPHKQHHCLLLLDTEGLGNVENDAAELDTWICALAVLFSTVLVFNSEEVINQSALMMFDNVMKLVRVIKEQIRASGKYADDSRFSPNFAWIVRDFALDLDINGEEVTPDQYLEHALRRKEGSKISTDYNTIRESFRNSFPNRKCFMFVFPSTKRKVQRLQDCDLDKDFIAECQKFCNYVYGVNPINTFPGRNRSSGETLSTLVEECIHVLNSGQISCLNKSVPPCTQNKNLKPTVPPAATPSDYQHNRGINKKEGLHSGRGEQFPDQTIPDRHDEPTMFTRHESYSTGKYRREMEREGGKEWFMGEYQRSNRWTGESYTPQVFIPQPNCAERQSQDSLQGHDPKHYERNEELTERCQNLLKSLFKSVDDKLKAGDYTVSGGYLTYVRDRNEMEEKYRSDSGNGIKANEVLEKYLKEKMSESEMVQMMDKITADKEREITAIKERFALSEQEKRTMSQKLEGNEQTIRQLNETILDLSARLWEREGK